MRFLRPPVEPGQSLLVLVVRGQELVCSELRGA